MKKGQKHAPKPIPPSPAPAPAQGIPGIPWHLAALEIVKSVNADGSCVCVHDLPLETCDDCGPIAQLAAGEATGEPAPALVESMPEDQTERVTGILDAFGEVPLLAAAEFPFAPGTLVPEPSVDQIRAEPTAFESEPMPEDLSVACAALGLAREHVLKHTPLGEGRCRILTHGGTSITWPDDRDKYTAQPLTQAQKDGIVRSKAHITNSLQKASEAAREKAIREASRAAGK